MTDNSLKLALESLTEFQRSAVDYVEGPALVLAGPGSGKTRILTTRVAKIISESPDKSFRVLALTFTNRAADEMSSRVNELIPNQERRFLIGTFHSFCMQILQQHGSHIGISSDFTIYSQNADREELLKDAISRIGFEANDLRYLSVIDELKSRLVHPNDTQKQFRDANLGSHISRLYNAYEEELQRSNALDFSSLILKSHQLLTTYPMIAESYRRIYSYWLFDEFQDTTNGQYQLLKALAGSNFKNIFVVADDDQIIYQWNGASFKQIQSFREEFSPIEIQLSTNFRCPPSIVDAANKLVVHNDDRTAAKLPLQSGKVELRYPNDQKIHILRFDTDENEVEGIALRVSNIDLDRRGEVAVLARNRSILSKLKDALSAVGVSSIILQRRDDFMSNEFLWLSAFLKLASRPLDEKCLDQMITAFNRAFDLQVQAVEILAASALSSKPYVLEWQKQISSVADQNADAVVLSKLAADFALKSSSFRRFTQAVLKRIDTTLENRGPEDAIQGDLYEDREAWRDLYRTINQSIGRDAELDAFVQELSLRSKEPPKKANDVSLMTIHASKGREFDHVYLIGLAEDVLPSYHSLKSGSNSAEMEEERRNCFVAITRACEWLCLSYADSYRGWSKQPSRFLTEMELDLPATPLTSP